MVKLHNVGRIFFSAIGTRPILRLVDRLTHTCFIFLLRSQARTLGWSRRKRRSASAAHSAHLKRETLSSAAY